MEDFEYEGSFKKPFKKNKEVVWSNEDFERESSKLIKEPCDYKRIFGYITQDKEIEGNIFVKYNKENELFVVYTYQENKPKIISNFRRTWRDYQGKMYDSTERYDYFDELPKGF